MKILLATALSMLVRLTTGLASTDTITWGGDNTRAGYQTNHNMDPGIVGSDSFGQIFKTALPGNYNGAAEQIFSQPLVYTPSDSTTQYVYFATTQNNIYKLDAKTGTILASRNLAIPFLTADLDGCVDINPLVGITSTGVVDPDTDTIYYMAKTYADQNGGNGAQGKPNGRYYLHAVDAHDLSERENFPVNLEGIVARNNEVRSFNGGIHHQRPGLLHSGQYIYAGFASHCVQYNFTGWIMGFDKTTGAVVERFATEGEGVPNTTPGGGVWMSGGGLASDDQGSLFFGSGNGYASQLSTIPVEGRNPPTSLEEAAVHMTINEDGSTTVVDFFMPHEKQALDGADKDLGTSPLELLPSEFSCGDIARMGVITGKSGKTYFLNLDDLGGYRTGVDSGDRVIQVYQNENSVYAGAGVYPLEGGYIYINVIQYPTHVFKFACNDGVPSFTKVADSPTNNAYILGVSHGTVTSLNGQPGTGMLWTIDVQGDNLRIYDAIPEDGYLTEIQSFKVPGTTKFTRAVFGDARLYLGTTVGYVYGFGAPVTLPLNCTSPVDFGSLDITAAGVTSTVTCTALIDTTIESVTLDDPDFNVTTTATLPVALAAGDTFSFDATFDPTSVGLLTGSVTIRTDNGESTYAESTAVMLVGTGLSAGPLLTILPTDLVFTNIVVDSEPEGTEQPVSFANEGNSTLTITQILYSETGLDGTWVSGTETASGTQVGAFTLSGLPSTIAANSGTTVTVNFLPTTGGNYSLHVAVSSDGGDSTFEISGNAGPAASCLLEFQTPDGLGWVPYEKNVNFTFGNVTENTSRTLKLRVTNNGTTDTVPLSLTVSKPPFGVSGSIIGTANQVDLAEGTIVKAGESAMASMYCAVPKAQWNTDTYYGSATWTINTNDPSWDKQYIQFSCVAVAEQAPPLQSDGQGVYRYVGCFKENNPGRQLPNQLYSDESNTNAMCIAACAEAGYTYCGTQYQRECWAGNSIPIEEVSDDDCNYACSGDINQICGGNGVGDDAGGAYISLFATDGADTTPDTTGPVVNPGDSGYTSVGCYHEPDEGRALSNALAVSEQTVADCLAAAAVVGYEYAGVEYGGECWAGDVLASGTTAVELTDCGMTCNGNNSEYCGGPLLLNMYALSGASPLPSLSSSVASSVAASSTVAGPSASTSAEATPTVTGGPYTNPGTDGFSFIGCWNEPPNARALTFFLSTSPRTVANCLAAAAAAGYAYAGVEYGGECWAGNTIDAAASEAELSACTMTCSGNQTEYCGGSLLLNLYEFDATTSPTSSVSSVSSVSPTSSVISVISSAASISTASASVSASATSSSASASTTPALAGWVYEGCYTEGTSSRALDGISEATGTMTLETCAAFCVDYAYFGVEYSSQCFCGNYFTTGSVAASESDCSMACAGDASQLCGGGDRLNVYYQTGKQTGLPAAQARIGDYVYLGCYSEATATRALSADALFADDMTEDMCATYCAAAGNYTLFGVEYATQCYCGNVLEAGSTAQDEDSCNMACGGDDFELCGGGNRLNVFTYSPASASSAPFAVADESSSVVVPSSSAIVSSTLSPFANSSVPTSSSSSLSSFSSIAPATSSLASNTSFSLFVPVASPLAASSASSASSTSPASSASSASSPSSSPAASDPSSDVAPTSAATTSSSSVAAPSSTTSTSLSPVTVFSSSTASASKSSNRCTLIAPSANSTSSASVSLTVQTSASSSGVVDSSSAIPSSSVAQPSASSAPVAGSPAVAAIPISGVQSPVASSSPIVSSQSAPASPSSSTEPSPAPSSSAVVSSSSVSASPSSSSVHSLTTSSSAVLSSSSSSVAPSSSSSAVLSSSSSSVVPSSSSSSVVPNSSSSVSSASSSPSASASAAPETLDIEPVVNEGNVNFTLVSCYEEPSSGHLLADLMMQNLTSMTVQRCLGMCWDYAYAGVENGTQCWCGDSLDLTGRNATVSGTQINDTKCDTLCTGNNTEYCGAPDKMLVYNLTRLSYD